MAKKQTEGHPTRQMLGMVKTGCSVSSIAKQAKKPANPDLMDGMTPNGYMLAVAEGVIISCEDAGEIVPVSLSKRQSALLKELNDNGVDWNYGSPEAKLFASIKWRLVKKPDVNRFIVGLW